VEGLALVTATAGVIATTRPVAVRAAMQSLHAERIPAHVSRVSAARRAQYVLIGVEPEVVQMRSTSLCCTRSRLRGAFLGAGRLARFERKPFRLVEAALLGEHHRERALRLAERATVAEPLQHPHGIAQEFLGALGVALRKCRAAEHHRRPRLARRVPELDVELPCGVEV